MGGQHSAGKGDKYRKVDLEKYRENYDKIFSKKKGKKKNEHSTSKTKQRRRTDR
jgi:uncharacterized protein VirK/YbjX